MNIVNHDLHIHSHLSLCSRDPEQNTQRILKYALDNNLRKICLTDHFWDENVPGSLNDFYSIQDFNHISASLPLPESEKTEFLFGCETELDFNCRLGLSPERMSAFDFIIIPTTHLHMAGLTIRPEDTSVEIRSRIWMERLEAVLRMPLPFEKVGIAHLTCSLIAPEWDDHIKIIENQSNADLYSVMKAAAKSGVGIEINMPLPEKLTPRELEIYLRIFLIAKECGCKFYFGSDAHHPPVFDRAIERFEKYAELLGLKEENMFQLKA